MKELYRFRQFLPKTMRWVYKQLVSLPRYQDYTIWITYLGKYRTPYKFSTLAKNERFMRRLYKDMPITKLEVEYYI